VRTIRFPRGKRGAYIVTDAQRPMSEDINYRQRRYLIMMGIRVVGLVLAVFLFHGVARFIAAAVAIVMPYFAVVFANGGREPDSGRRFEPYDPDAPERAGLTGAPFPGPWEGRDETAGNADPAADPAAGGDPDGGAGRPAGEDSPPGGDSSLSAGEAAADPASHGRTGANPA
jgi:hypothetical protein